MSKKNKGRGEAPKAVTKTPETTSPEVATKAAAILQDDNASADVKSVAASALTQAADKEEAPVAPEVTAEPTIEPAADAPAETVEPKADISPPKVRRHERPEVSHNPSQIVWPTDVWGITKNLKKEFLTAASRLNGQRDKKELLDRTLHIAHAHLEAKFAKDCALNDARIEKAAAAEQAEATKEPTLF